MVSEGAASSSTPVGLKPNILESKNRAPNSALRVFVLPGGLGVLVASVSVSCALVAEVLASVVRECFSAPLSAGPELTKSMLVSTVANSSVVDLQI